MQPVMPKLILNFDVNGTLILKDSSKKTSDEDMLISALAENSIEKWDSRYEEMSFKKYVYDKLLPGKKSDGQLKKERQKIVGTFLKRICEQSHPCRDTILKEYQQIKDKFTDPKTGKTNFTVFPSFYRMLDKLCEMEIPFTIILRTFGSDLPDVVKEIEAHPSGIKITRWAKFEDTNLNITGERTVEKINDVFNVFLESEQHFAIQDNWKKWNQDDEKGRSGKPFLYDATGENPVKNLSLFFDDNITGEEEDIVHPCEITGNNPPPKTLCNRLMFPVNTKKAMLKDNYYTKRVLKALKIAESR